MADLAKLKKKAAELESAKKLDKAIAAYREILDLYDSGAEADVDVALYNRVGDLVMRHGDTAEAVTLYERAVDLYAEGGFFNNAIALCNKVLRTSPGRASVYYKLGKISAAKGFKGDAKQNFLEYADRMQKAGNKDEAFRALKEFADLCPDQDDIRLMLADQLIKADRKVEALDQLLALHERLVSLGQTAEAEATLERMRSIDPNVEVKEQRRSQAVKAHDDLIFIDLDAPVPRKPRLSVVVPKIEPTPPPTPVVPAEPVVAETPAPEEGASPDDVAPPVELVADSAGESEFIVPAMEGIEATHFEAPAAPAEGGALLGLETTSLVPDDVPESAPLSAGAFAALDLAQVAEAPSPARESLRDLALPGDLPLIDTSAVDLPLIAPAMETPVDLPLIEPAMETPVELPLIDFGDETPLPLIEPVAESAAAEPALDIELPMIEVGAEDELAADVESPTAFGELDIETIESPPPAVRRTTAMAIPMHAASIEDLRDKVMREPANWTLRRQLAETMLDDGQRADGLAMLEEAMAGFERDGQMHEARSLADELVRLDPSSVKHHQKRVEFAFRVDDRAGLAQGYLDLGDALLREGQADKARAVYQRVLEIDAHDIRALAALEALRAATPLGTDATTDTRAPSIPATAQPSAGKRYTGRIESVPEAPVPAPVPGSDDDYVSLGDWLRDEEGPKNTRMVVEEQEPTGDEDADFQDMLRKFKQGVAQNVEEEDHESHYDLGVAYKEMGLLDEAIAEFQKALRGTTRRVRTYEALGQCFLEKGQLQVALTILQRALHEPGVADDQLVGVLYLLGYASEGLKKPADAKAYYERVFSVDIQFRDIGERLNAVEAALS